MTPKVSAKRGEVVFSLPKRLYALELVQGAAHVLSDRCTAWLDETKTAWAVTLEAKGAADAASLRALAREFGDELANQSLRQRLIANARPVFEHIVARAVVSARRDESDAAQPPAARAAELSKEQKAELDRLVAEAERELAARRKDGVLAETAKTWEERHGHPRTGR